MVDARLLSSNRDSSSNVVLQFKRRKKHCFLNNQCIRCYKNIRIKIAVLWFHGPRHIEQIDVRFLNRTQDRNDVSTCNLVQMWSRHRYTTLFSLNFKILFEILIMVKIMIQNILSMIMCLMLPHTFVPSMTSMGCLTFKLEMFQYLTNQRRCYVTIATNV